MDFFRKVRTILSADLNIVARVERLYVVRRVRSSAGLRPDGLHHHDPFHSFNLSHSVPWAAMTSETWV